MVFRGRVIRTTQARSSTEVRDQVHLVGLRVCRSAAGTAVAVVAPINQSMRAIDDGRSDNDPETARDSVRLLSLGVNPDVRRRTTPRQYVLLRQPVRRVGRRRGARPGGGEKVDGRRQASGERCERRDACRCSMGRREVKGNECEATRR
jgi:hypothetical protein